MTSEIYKKIIGEIYYRILENEDTSSIRNIIDKLKKIINEIEADILSAKKESEEELLNAEKEIISKLYRLLQLALVEYGLKKGNNTLNSIYETNNKEDRVFNRFTVGIVLRDIPKFRGSDRELYGPFKARDIILINEKDFNKLKDRGLLKEEEIHL